MNTGVFSLKVGLSDGFSLLFWLFGSSLIVKELLRIGVCRFLSIDEAVSLRTEELISDTFVPCNWGCEWFYCILPISFVEL